MKTFEDVLKEKKLFKPNEDLCLFVNSDGIVQRYLKDIDYAKAVVAEYANFIIDTKRNGKILENSYSPNACWILIAACNTAQKFGFFNLLVDAYKNIEEPI